MRRTLLSLAAVALLAAGGCAECCNFLCPGASCHEPQPACAPANPYDAGMQIQPGQPVDPYITPSPN